MKNQYLAKLLFTSLMSVMITFFSFGQLPRPMTFGKVDLADLQMKTYAKDTSAVAVVLCDYGEYFYNFIDGGSIPKVVYRRHIRIKILKQAGFNFANRRIAYYMVSDPDRAETVDNFHASTWNLEDGNQVSYSLDGSDLFDDKGTDNIYYKTFTFPQVRVGSVLEYTYEIESGVWYDMRTWYFQDDIPKAWCELRAEIPGYFEFNMTLRSQIPLKIREMKQGEQNFIRGNIRDPFLSYRFVMADVPALKEEAYLTTIENFRAKLDFELSATQFPGQEKQDYTQTWESLNATLLDSDYLGKQLKKYSQAEKIAATLKATSKDSLSLLKAAYKYIQNSMQWDGERSWSTSKQNLNKVADKHLGNSAEINLMLVRLLRECGFDANPFLLSTREHGAPSNFVLLKKFNSLIVHVNLNGKDVFLDATNKLTSVGQLPFECLNEKGRLIVKGEGRWIDIPAKEVSKKVLEATLEILPEQVLKGDIHITHSGYESINFRAKVVAKGKESFISEYKKARANEQVSKIEVLKLDTLEASPELKVQTQINDAYSIAGDRIYLSAMMGMGEKANPFQSPTRTYPVDFGVPQEENFTITFKLPANYVVEEAPKNELVNLPNDGGRFEFKVFTFNGEVRIESKRILKKNIYTNYEYLALREFYNKIVAKHAEQIVLKKK